MGTAAPHRTASMTPGSARLLIPILIGLEFFSGLVQGWIVPLLGEIAKSYEVQVGTASWVLVISLLSSAVSVPLLSILGDRYGHRLLLVVSVALAAAGSLLIALGPGFAWVLVGAAIQGPVAAFLPLAMGLLKTHRPATASKDVGLLVGTLTFGVAAGSLLGGIAMDAIGQLHLAQLLPALMLTLFVPVIGFFVAEGTPDDTRVVDWLGALLLGMGVVGIMYGLSEAPHAGWTNPAALIPLVLGLAALLAFLQVERRAQFPLVDIPAMRTAGLAVPIFVGFLVALVMFGNQAPPVMFLTASPDELGYGNNLLPSAVGLVSAVSAGSLTIGSFLSYPAAKVLGRGRAIFTACLISAGALLCMAYVPSSTVLFAVWLTASGIATGVAVGILPGIVIERSSESAAASVAGAYNTARTIGGSLAGAFVASVTTLLIVAPGSGGAADAPSLAAFQVVWTSFAVVNVVAAIAALFISGRTAEKPAGNATAESSVGASL